MKKKHLYISQIKIIINCHKIKIGSTSSTHCEIVKTHFSNYKMFFGKRYLYVVAKSNQIDSRQFHIKFHLLLRGNTSVISHKCV